ncbi:hypothetical protein B7463_g3046, partial [Scytalidium lignicola]
MKRLPLLSVEYLKHKLSASASTILLRSKAIRCHLVSPRPPSIKSFLQILYIGESIEYHDEAMAQIGSNPFIITTPLQQPDLSSRRYVRSNAMLDKNRGKRGKRRVQPPCPASWINGLSQGRASTDVIPRQVGSGWALGRFAEVGSDMLQNVFKFITVLEQASHPNPILADDDGET